MVEVLNTVYPQKVGGKIEIAGIMAQVWYSKSVNNKRFFKDSVDF